MDGVVTIALLGASVCLPTVVAVCLFSNRVRDIAQCLCANEERREKRSVCRGRWSGASVSLSSLLARKTASKETVVATPCLPCESCVCVRPLL